MCEGFGMIATSDLRGYFCRPDVYGNISHTEILKAIGMAEDDQAMDGARLFVRRFVRLENPDWMGRNLRFDEEGSLPGWAEENREQIFTLARKMVEQARPAVEAYLLEINQAQQEQQEARMRAREAYYIAVTPAREKYLVAVRQETEATMAELARLKDAYEGSRLRVAASVSYKAETTKVDEKYEQALEIAREEYRQARFLAQEVFEAALVLAGTDRTRARERAYERMVGALRKIPGFVEVLPEKSEGA